MTVRSSLALVAALYTALACAPADAGAQGWADPAPDVDRARRIDLGEQTTGRLSGGDRTSGGRAFDDYVYHSYPGLGTLYVTYGSYDVPLRLQLINPRTGSVYHQVDLPAEHTGEVTLSDVRRTGDEIVRVMAGYPGATGTYHVSISQSSRLYSLEAQSQVDGFHLAMGGSASAFVPQGQGYADQGYGLPLRFGIGWADRYAVFVQSTWEELDDADQTTLLQYEAGARLYMGSRLGSLRPYVQLSGGILNLDPLTAPDQSGAHVGGGLGAALFFDPELALELLATYSATTVDAFGVFPQSHSPIGRVFVGLSWHPWE